MNDLNCKCKCLKKVRIIEITTYMYDEKCLADFLQNKSKLPKKFQVNVCKSKNVLENNTRSSKILQYFLAPNTNKQEIKKCKLEPFKECHTEPTDMYFSGHSKSTKNQNNPKKISCEKIGHTLNKD